MGYLIKNKDYKSPETSCKAKGERRLGIPGLLMLFLFLSAGLLWGCAGGPDKEPLESVPAGTWIETFKVAEADGKPHAVKYIVDRFVRDPSEVAAAIEAFNRSPSGYAISPLENENLEFCLMEYRVAFPKDFPQRRDGILDVAVPFRIVSLYGDDIEVDNTIYRGLGETVEIGDQPEGYDFHRGDTYHGVIVFAMVKGFDGYLVQEMEREEPQGSAYVRGE